MSQRSSRKRPLPPPAVEPAGSSAAELLKISPVDGFLGPHGDRRSAVVTDGPPHGVDSTEAATSGNAADAFIERSESSVGYHEVQDNHHKGALAPCQRPLPSRSHSQLIWIPDSQRPVWLIMPLRLHRSCRVACRSVGRPPATCTAYPVDNRRRAYALSATIAPRKAHRRPACHRRGHC